jgi:hypothetical protein
VFSQTSIGSDRASGTVNALQNALFHPQHPPFFYRTPEPHSLTTYADVHELGTRPQTMKRKLEQLVIARKMRRRRKM